MLNSIIRYKILHLPDFLLFIRDILRRFSRLIKIATPPFIWHFFISTPVRWFFSKFLQEKSVRCQNLPKMKDFKLWRDFLKSSDKKTFIFCKFWNLIDSGVEFKKKCDSGKRWSGCFRTFGKRLKILLIKFIEILFIKSLFRLFRFLIGGLL